MTLAGEERNTAKCFFKPSQAFFELDLIVDISSLSKFQLKFYWLSIIVVYGVHGLNRQTGDQLLTIG